MPAVTIIPAIGIFFRARWRILIMAIIASRVIVIGSPAIMAVMATGSADCNQNSQQEGRLHTASNGKGHVANYHSGHNARKLNRDSDRTDRSPHEDRIGRIDHSDDYQT